MSRETILLFGDAERKVSVYTYKVKKFKEQYKNENKKQDETAEKIMVQILVYFSPHDCFARRV